MEMRTILSTLLLLTSYLVIGQSYYSAAPGLTSLMPHLALFNMEKESVENASMWGQLDAASQSIYFSEWEMHMAEVHAREIESGVIGDDEVIERSLGEYQILDMFDTEVKGESFMIGVAQCHSGEISYTGHFSLVFSKTDFAIIDHNEATGNHSAGKAYQFFVCGRNLLDVKEIIRHILFNIERTGYEYDSFIGTSNRVNTGHANEIFVLYDMQGRKVFEGMKSNINVPSGYYISHSLVDGEIIVNKKWIAN